jgi:hypothetical protein
VRGDPLLQRAHYDTTGEVQKSATEAFVESFAGGRDPGAG